MSNTKEATDPITEFLEQAKPSEVDVALCLNLELRDRYTAANIELAQLLARPVLGRTDDEKKDAADRLAAEQWAKAEEVEAIGKKMADAETIFLLRNISWMDRAVLAGTHPPRDDNSGDKRIGYNRATLYPALVAKTIAEITFPDKAPAPITPEQWERFAAVLEPEQMETLATSAVNLVWRPADPKSALASETLKARSDGKSKPRGRSESRTVAS